MMSTHLTTTRRLPVAFVVPDWAALGERLTDLLVHAGLLLDAGRSGSSLTLDYVGSELARANVALSVATTRWETRNRSGLIADGRARAIAMARAYDDAISAAGQLADLASEALDRELRTPEVEGLLAAAGRAITEVARLR